MRYTGEGDPGTVVVATNHLGRYSDFEMALEDVVVPTGTLLIRAKSGSVTKNQNVGIAHRRGAWVWFMDDDHTFERDVLMRLLARNVDIVAPLCPFRFPPYGPVLYKRLDITETNGRVTQFHEEFYALSDLTGVQGLLPVQGLPKAGCLIRESVWAKLPAPVFKMGLIHPDEIEDDKYFMWEVRERYGYTLWCDTDHAINHLTTVGVGIKRDEVGGYHFKFTG